MNIEKALRNYIEGKGNKIKYEEFINLVKSNGNNAANVLFIRTGKNNMFVVRLHGT